MSSRQILYPHKLYRRLSAILIATLLLSISVTGSAWAISVQGDDTVAVGKNEVIDDDLVLAGNLVTVDGVVNGDLVAVGSQITINGEVKGSLVAAGQTIILNGKVGGSVYSGGAAITVGPTATIARNMIFGGYSYRSEQGSYIGRDSLLGGYQGTINGESARNLYASLGALELNGIVGGNVQAFVETPNTPVVQFWPIMPGQQLPPAIPPGLRVGPDAMIRGTFSYVSPVEQSEGIAVRPEGGIIFSTPQPATTGSSAAVVPPAPTNRTAEWFLARLREVVSLLAVGALALWLMPKIFDQVGDRSRSQALLAGAWGMVVVLLGYGGALLLLVLLISLVAALGALTLTGLATTTFGIGFSALGLAFSLFSVLVAYGSKLVVAYALSHALLERFSPASAQYRILPLGLGALAFVLLRSIPYIGWIISLAATLVGLGAMWLVFLDRVSRSKRAAPKMVLTPA
jgi:hypothetical protein